MKILQQDARTSNAEIARRVGLAPSAILERIRKLERQQVIEGYTARIDPRVLRLGLLAFVFVRTEEGVSATETAAALARLPEVLEVHDVAGEDCVLAKVRVADTEALARLLRERFGALPAVRSTRTTIVLETVKETSRLPLEAGRETKEEGDHVRSALPHRQISDGRRAERSPAAGAGRTDRRGAGKAPRRGRRARP